jgi:hypothetical protein
VKNDPRVSPQIQVVVVPYYYYILCPFAQSLCSKTLSRFMCKNINPPRRRHYNLHLAIYTHVHRLLTCIMLGFILEGLEHYTYFYYYIRHC